jgi:hypothetical protein
LLLLLVCIVLLQLRLACASLPVFVYLTRVPCMLSSSFIFPSYQIMAISPALMPELLCILRSDEYGPSLQRKALTILHTILEVLQVGFLGVWLGLGGCKCGPCSRDLGRWHGRVDGVKG